MGFEVDTGASRTIMGEPDFVKLKTKNAQLRLVPSKVVLKSYTGERILVLGAADADVKWNRHKQCLRIIIVQGQGPNFLGRDWMPVIRTGRECLT